MSATSDFSPESQAEKASSPEAYTFSYHQATDFVRSRRAARQAAFLLPHLRPGLSLLDCGCGPGTITSDLAELVAPGEALGIDVDPIQIEEARAYAVSREVSNARFEVASIYELPFPEASFDAVFIHGVLEHLQRPVRALQEVLRMLKVGGVLGTRHGDLGGHLLAPEDPRLERFLTLWRLTSQHDGAGPDFGRHQLAALHQAGFGRVVASASYDCWTETPAVRAGAARFMIDHIMQSRAAAEAIELGLADRAALEETAAALEEWAHDPTGFAAGAWGEAVAWKE